jgi:hypothetical protein
MLGEGGTESLLAAPALAPTVESLLRQRQRRHENDQQHQQHVNERRDVRLDLQASGRRSDAMVGSHLSSHGLDPVQT